MTDMLALSNDIADQLPQWQGKGWTAVYESDYYRLKHPDGPWLTLHTRGIDGKTQITACGSFSTGLGTENSFEDLCDRLDHKVTLQVKRGVGFDSKREPQAVAKDIQRRLLAVYLPLYQQGLAAKQANKTALNAKEVVLQQLAAALGVTACDGTLTCHNFGDSAPKLWCEISVNSPTSLNVKLVGLTPEQWSRLLGVLKEQPQVGGRQRPA